MTPFVPSENKGIKSLAFLTAAADIGVETDSLAFLNIYLGRFHGMTVNGNGELSGHIEMENGMLKPETDVVVSASELSMDLLSHRVLGTGSINLTVQPDHPDVSQFAINFGKLQAFHSADKEPLLSGEGLSIKLKSKQLKTRIDEQAVSGKLTVDIKLAGGVPENMDFDISGSSIVLEEVRVVGGEKNFDKTGWRARFELGKGRAVWKKPTRIEMEAGIEMKDTRPIVAIMANQREKHGWIEKILTVEDVKGDARIHATEEKIVIPYAFCGSDDIDVGAKGLITVPSREGVFFARYKELKGLLKVKDGDRNFDILRARKKFDGYSPGDFKQGFRRRTGEHEAKK